MDTTPTLTAEDADLDAEDRSGILEDLPEDVYTPDDAIPGDLPPGEAQAAVAAAETETGAL